jgi:hypothetical protein
VEGGDVRERIEEHRDSRGVVKEVKDDGRPSAMVG